MKVLVTGVNGQLGHDVMSELKKRGHEAIGVDVAEMDITDANAVHRVLSEIKPEAVVHCAAWTAVDAAEDEENYEKVRLVNVAGTENIAKESAKLDCKMMYITTDYVFDGQGELPWKPDDARNPLNVYGQTKSEGELAVEALVNKYFIVRIAWVFGKNGNNFIKTMLKVGKNHTGHCTTLDELSG
ncbi:MAG: sugar nucleotide-binding protein, partial [Clostridia bacterium]|nr:sugar nucleotide-binding protein [Clostridia bacterium]